MKPEDKKQQRKRNVRTGLILLSVAAVFFAGIMVRKIMEPSILTLVQ